MKRFLLAGAAAALVPLCASAALHSAELTPELRAQAEDFAINNVTTSLYHEFGHLLIDQFEWPVLGREENAADMIMTMLLLDEGEDAVTIAGDAVRGYMKASARYGEALPEKLDLRGEHELEMQRGYLMACVLVGSNKDDYEALAEEISLGNDRTDGCRDDARTAERSWDSLKDEMGERGRRDRDDDDDDDDEDREERQRGALGETMSVEYEDAGADYAMIAELMKSRRLLETFADKMASTFPLRREATVKAKLCGDDDAYYGSNEITLCYEYVQFYYDLIADPENAGAGMI